MSKKRYDFSRGFSLVDPCGSVLPNGRAVALTESYMEDMVQKHLEEMGQHPSADAEPDEMEVDSVMAESLLRAITSHQPILSLAKHIVTMAPASQRRLAERMDVQLIHSIYTDPIMRRVIKYILSHPAASSRVTARAMRLHFLRVHRRFQKLRSIPQLSRLVGLQVVSAAQRKRRERECGGAPPPSRDFQTATLSAGSHWA